MSSKKKLEIKPKKSKKMSKLDNWIHSISMMIQNLLDGTMRQCHNDTFNSYVVKTKVKSLKSKLRILKQLKKEANKNKTLAKVRRSKVYNNIEEDVNELAVKY